MFPLGITSAEKNRLFEVAFITDGILPMPGSGLGYRQLHINRTSKSAEKPQMCYCIAKPNINKQSLKIANIKQGNNLCFLLYSHPIRIVLLTRHLNY